MNDIFDLRNEFLSSKGLTLVTFNELPEAEQRAMMIRFMELPTVRAILIENELADNFSFRTVGAILTGGVSTLFNKNATTKDKLSSLLTGGVSQVVKPSGGTKPKQNLTPAQLQQIAKEHQKGRSSNIKEIGGSKPNMGGSASPDSEKKGMSKGLKIGLIGGGAVLLVVLAIVIIKKLKK